MSSASTCAKCRITPTVIHPELASLSIAHIDCDAFFAAIEKRDAPELRSKPVAIGGGKRGVVATACYTARLFGVRSAMPMFKALKLCPELVVVKPNSEKYTTASRQIKSKMSELTPLVQSVSIDEAYLDLSGTENLHGHCPAVMLSRLQNDIQSDIGITVSVGLSFNRFLAKSASELDKPKGFAVIGQSEAKTFLSDKPIDFIHGVGPALTKKVNAKGFHTLGDLQISDKRHLISLLGEAGVWLHDRANGIGRRRVDPSSDRKTISSETTFNTDQSEKSVLEDQLWYLSEKTAFRAKDVNLQGAVVTLKLKTADFKTRTRRVSLQTATQLSHIIFQTGQQLLAREIDGTKFRLIGIGLSELEPATADIGDLLDPATLKKAKAERAADKARQKFGNEFVTSGRGIRLKAEREKSKRQT